jgi:hypothetical protein
VSGAARESAYWQPHAFDAGGQLLLQPLVARGGLQLEKRFPIQRDATAIGDRIALRLHFGQQYAGRPQPDAHYDYAVLYRHEDPRQAGLARAEVVWEDEVMRVYRALPRAAPADPAPTVGDRWHDRHLERWLGRSDASGGRQRDVAPAATREGLRRTPPGRRPGEATPGFERPGASLDGGVCRARADPARRRVGAAPALAPGRRGVVATRTRAAFEPGAPREARFGAGARDAATPGAAACLVEWR